MPDDVGVTDAALVETVAQAIMTEYARGIADAGRWTGQALPALLDSMMQPALDAAREAGRRDGLEQAAIEIARLRGGLASVAELLGSDLGHFRRAESVEAFLRGEKVDWMDADDAR